MYVRTVRGATLEFGHRGWLLDESFIFYDRQTDSLWVQATGRCIEGAYEGEQLATVPATHTTWGQWRAMAPGTEVLQKPPARLARYRRDEYEAFYRQQGTRFGLAVFAGSSQKLYPLEALEANPVVQDELGGEPVLVVYHARSRTAVAFEPVVDGRRARFELAETGESDVFLRDSISGNLWSGLTGRSRSDPRQVPLRQLQTTQFVLGNWHKHFPGAAIFGTR